MSIEEIVESLKSLTLLEAYQLVSKIETTFELDSSSLNPPITIVVETPPMGAMPSAPMPAITEGDTKNEEEKESKEEKTYNVIIESIPESSRVKTFKIIRKVKELKISEARDFADSVPQTLAENQPLEEAEKLKQELDQCGAVSKIV